MADQSRIEIIDKVVMDFLGRTSATAASAWQKNHSKNLETTIQNCVRGKPRKAYAIFADLQRDLIASETKLEGRELEGELGALWIDECHMRTPLFHQTTALAKLEAAHCAKPTKRTVKKTERQTPEDPAQMMVKELVENLQNLSLSTRGRKPDLIARLMEARRLQT